MSGRAPFVTVSAVYQTETAAAVCVRETEDEGAPDIWLPLSQVTVTPLTRALFSGATPARGDLVEITAPEWLLLEKGLI